MQKLAGVALLYLVIGLTPTKTSASAGGPIGWAAPKLMNPPLVVSSPLTVNKPTLLKVATSLSTNCSSLPVTWTPNAIEPLDPRVIKASEKPIWAANIASFICLPRTAPSTSNAYDSSRMFFPRKAISAFVISSCSLGNSRRGAISLFRANISPSEIDCSASDDTQITASENSSPITATITTHVYMAIQFQPWWGAGIQDFSLRSTRYSPINPAPINMAKTTNPNSPPESHSSASAFELGINGNPMKKFQIILGISCMLVTGEWPFDCYRMGRFCLLH